MTEVRPPRFVIQHDWNEALLAEKPEMAWLNLRKKNEPAGYFKIALSDKLTDAKLPCIKCTEPSIEGFFVNKNIISLKKSNTELQCHIAAPVDTFSDIHENNIYSIDVNQDGLVASSDSSGQLIIWHNTNREYKKNLYGHVADVYACRFYPSGHVLLSGGADMMLKIWYLETGQCAQTIKGHTGAINDIEFIEKGKNVVSCSKDGTCKLWDCGTATCLAEFGCLDSVYINALVVQSEESTQTTSAPASNTLECGTSRKIITLGYENGTLRNYALESREMIYDLKVDSAVNAVIDLSSNLVVCGTDSGKIITCDIRNSGTPLFITDDDRGAVLSLAKYGNGSGYFAAFGDGTVCFKKGDPPKNVSCPGLELSGPNLDPVNRIVVRNEGLYSCCRDGKVRKYNLKILAEKGIFS